MREYAATRGWSLVAQIQAEDSEDVFQSACVYAWERRDFFDPIHYSFEQWIVFITMNKKRDLLRIHSRRREEALVDTRADGRPLADVALANQELAERIISQYPSGSRERLILQLYLEGFKRQEIAHHLDVSVETITAAWVSIRARALRLCLL